jgi:hypothetical protein
MKKIIFAIIAIITMTGICLAQTAGTAGSFARMGSGARGVAMGNALTAVTIGEISPYYNPALSAFSINRNASATFTLLSLDRSLNFLSYTQGVKPTAGISFGLINAGVSNIDGRDNDGNHTENYSTYENQFFLSFSNKVHERVSLGVTVKLYHSKLFNEVKSTTVGFDVGACILILDNLTAGIAVQDIGSKYIWDTKKIYPDPYGTTTTDHFPNLRRIGLAYSIPKLYSLITAEFENSSEGTNILRGGVEVNPMEYLSLRCGIDRIDFSDEATGAKPSFGFAIKKKIGEYIPNLSYAFIAEPFAPHSYHMLTLTVIF